MKIRVRRISGESYSCRFSNEWDALWDQLFTPLTLGEGPGVRPDVCLDRFQALIPSGFQFWIKNLNIKYKA
jgi:hypothetical protein